MQESDAWSRPLADIYSEFSSSPDGLSAEQARDALKRFGPNAVRDRDRREWNEILLSQVRSPLMLLLIFAAIVSSFLGDVFDAMIIVGVLMFSAFLGFAQEYKSEKVLSELKKYFTHHAVVMRGGQKIQLDSRQLVPGDIVTVGIGDIVPADLRIIGTSGVAADEAMLTGESRPVEKNADALPAGAAGGVVVSAQQITNGLFMGSSVVDGSARCIVIATGESTLFGQMAITLSARTPESDFQKGIRRFGSAVLKLITAMALFIFLSNYLLGHGGVHSLTDSALFALALAVGIAPEALPAIITITLASGSVRMARKKVVTKKLAAIEDLGNMDVLCTDKTGTLTREGIMVDGYVDLDKKDSADVFEYAMLCNSAVGSAFVKGNPIDAAIRRHGLQQKVDLSKYKRLDEIPFDYQRRRMGRVVEKGSRRMLIVKGAPESVLAACTKIQMAGREMPLAKKEKELREMIRKYNEDGVTTIAVAAKDVGSGPKAKYSKADEAGMTMLGFVLLSNPPKQSVRSTLERLRQLNVNLKILTGDDALVTRKLCTQIGFGIEGGRIVLGSEMHDMSEAQVRVLVEKCNVFARVSPDQKLAIVEALKANGHVVGFLGDGINDAPALRTADVGISVDSAAEVAKGASHMILLQKSLAVVCDGVEEGRKIFGNITKYILNTMSSNNGNMLTIAISSLFLPFIPLLPAQILLNNLLSDVPMLGISTDNVDASYRQRPRKWDIGLIVRFMIFFGAISTFFDFVLILAMRFLLHTPEDEFRTAWFLMSLLTEVAIVFSMRTRLPFFRSMPSLVLLGGSLFAAALGFFVISFAPIAVPFHFVPLSGTILALIFGTIAAYFIVNEIGKLVFFGRIEKEV